MSSLGLQKQELKYRVGLLEGKTETPAKTTSSAVDKFRGALSTRCRPWGPPKSKHWRDYQMAGTLGMYRIWIANLAASDSNNRWSAAARFDACNLLKDLFNSVIADPACKFTFCSWFLFEPQSSVLANGELLIYILASSRNSIINSQPSHPKIDLDKGGNTFPVGGNVISEIYLGAGPRTPLGSILGDSNYKTTDCQ